MPLALNDEGDISATAPVSITGLDSRINIRCKSYTIITYFNCVFYNQLGNTLIDTLLFSYIAQDDYSIKPERAWYAPGANTVAFCIAGIVFVERAGIH